MSLIYYQNRSISMVMVAGLMMLILSSCAERNPIEPPIPHADAGYSTSRRTWATVGAVLTGYLGDVTVIMENDARAQMYVRANWDCHRFAQFVANVTHGIQQGRSKEESLKLVYDLNIKYNCIDCPQGIERIRIVERLYDHKDEILVSMPTQEDIQKYEEQCYAYKIKK